MAYILSIDASAKGCSVAVFINDELLTSNTSFLERSAAEGLTLLIESTLAAAKLEYSDLNAIAVAKGPGSYTGLRIAVSTAKGLSFGLDLPLLSYGTLHSMVYQIESTAYDLVCPMLDARRMEVYAGFFDATTKQESVETQAVIVENDSFGAILDKNKVLFIGDGSQKCKTTIDHANAYFYEEEISPNAKFSGTIIFEKFKNKDFEDLVKFEPFYLKEYMFKTKKP